MEWTRLRVEVPEAAADAIVNFLFEAGATGVITAASDDDPPVGDGSARLEVHLPAGQAEQTTAALMRYLSSLVEIEPAAHHARVESTPLALVDGETAFRQHHRPVYVGNTLCVAPPWDVPAAPGRHVLVIDPGMAFGTGQHATTRTCLEVIECTVATGDIASALDVGTGSGVLAAALSRLGVPRVVALDEDTAVLPIVRRNVGRSGAPYVLLLAGRVDALRGRFDLVVANLFANVLVAEAAALAATVAPSGHLILSGLLDSQADAVRAAYAGFTPVAELAEQGWRTLHFVRPRT